jgi:hypothetical protein
MTTIEIVTAGGDHYIEDLAHYIDESGFTRYTSLDLDIVVCKARGSKWAKEVADSIIEFLREHDGCRYIDASISIEREKYLHIDKSESWG